MIVPYISPLSFVQAGDFGQKLHSFTKVRKGEKNQGLLSTLFLGFTNSGPGENYGQAMAYLCQ